MNNAHDFCSMIFNSCFLPISRVSYEGEVLFQFTPFSPESDPLRGTPDLICRFRKALEHRPEMPFIEVTEEYLMLGAIACKNMKDGFYIVGPVPYLFSFSDECIEDLAEKYGIYDRQTFAQTIKYSLPRMTGRQFASTCCILQEYETGSFDYEAVLSSFKIEEPDNYNALSTLARNRVYETSADVWTLPLKLARPLMKFILAGDGNAALKYADDNRISLGDYIPVLKQSDGYSGKETEDDDYYHYAVIMIAAFAAYIAQEATDHGLKEETAWLLWWHYTELAMNAKNADDINQCFRSVIYDFAQRAGQLYQDKEYLTQQSLSYIRRHVGEKLSPSDVAEDVGVSGNYLNRIFKRDMGRSIHRQIQLEKINAAKTLLAYTDEGILDISQILQFNSQSYFTNVFKKITGLTPQAYRDQFKKNK